MKIFLTGASSGIGLATAKALVAAGHEVWGTSRDPRRLPDLSRLHPIALDLAELDSVRENFATALRQAGDFDVVINNGGSGHFGPAESLPLQVWQNQIQVLLVAQIELCRLALAAMQKRGRGLIINISSVASRLPVPFMSAYNAAKAAMASFTMTLQLELRDRDIHVVDLQPADIRTRFNDVIARTEASQPQLVAAMAQAWEVADRNLRTAPPPELVARAILKLIAQKNPPCRVTVGNFLQAKIATTIFRFLPQNLRVWGLRNHYRI